MRQWIRGGSNLNDSNIRHQKRGERAFATTAEGYSWLLQADCFKNWIAQKDASRGVWLRGSCGTGKSVICSYVIKYVKSTAVDAGVAFHYYRFDEQVPSTTVYRNVAEQLYDQLYLQEDDDISDSMHDLVKNKSDNQESLKEMIRLLVYELSQSYIFVDGLDEECTDVKRWEDASDVVGFFKGLAEEEGSTVGFWCGCQDRSNIREILTSFPKLQLDESTNKGTIESFFANTMTILESLDVDPGMKALVIDELKTKARGSFLWASLMVDTIKDATNLQELQKELSDALPKDFESYYSRKIRAIEEKHRGTVR